MSQVFSWAIRACLTSAAVASICIIQLSASAQIGDVPLAVQGTEPAESTQPDVKAVSKKSEDGTQISRHVAAKLDTNVTLSLETGLDFLADALSEELGIPVFTDSRAIALTGLDPSQTMVKFESDHQPLRSILRKTLQPLELRAEVQDDGLVITADFSELTRRGIMQDQWVGLSDELMTRVDAALATEVELPIHASPLENAIAEFSRAVDFPMVIDRTALEGIGLTSDTPVNGQSRIPDSNDAGQAERPMQQDVFDRGPNAKATPADNPFPKDEDEQAEIAKPRSIIQRLPLSAVLDLTLRDLELTYTIRNGLIKVTTMDSAEQELLNRLYFLEGTGLPRGDFGSTMSMIQGSIYPDSWAALGGRGTMHPINNGQNARPTLLISATLNVHQQIAELMQALRDSHFGPDPIGSDQPATQQRSGWMGSGISGGWMGGMGGGMGGMSGGMGGMSFGGGGGGGSF